VDFPAAALKAKKLKEIRLELAYIPSPYQEETVNFTVSIGEGEEARKIWPAQGRTRLGT
jgi:hypothetical protein